MTHSDKRQYIHVEYKDREIAKRLGAWWDSNLKLWYYLPGSTLEKIYQWKTK